MINKIIASCVTAHNVHTNQNGMQFVHYKACHEVRKNLKVERIYFVHTSHVWGKLFCIPLIYHFPIRMNLLRIDSVQSTLHGALTFLGYSQH